MASYSSPNGVALYNKRDFIRDQWMNYRAYKAVQHLDKFRWDFDGADRRRESTDESYHSDDSDGGTAESLSVPLAMTTMGFPVVLSTSLRKLKA